ncbi:MAG: hypothetical protein JNM07_00815 [Phycisphaerae bacterium]|nr:hypothetical protein [Phycisphaerae bacterium]
MSIPPVATSRVPTLLASQITLANLNRTNRDILTMQTQLATGREINRPSDDPVRAQALLGLRDVIARSEQRARNLDHASTMVDSLDAAVGQANDLVLQAKGVAASQIGATSDAETRSAQAIVIDSILKQLMSLANQQTGGVHLFGGSTPSRAPIVEQNGGFRYLGRGQGLRNDLGPGLEIPTTMGGDNAIGETSARLRSSKDLNPSLTLDTPLSDLRGARGLGLAPGSITFSFNGSDPVTIDLAGATNVAGIADRLTFALRGYEVDHDVAILGTGGVNISGGRFSIDVAPGGSLAFGDIGAGTAAQDLGLDIPFTSSSPLGNDLNPRLTLLTPLSAIPGLSAPPDPLRFRFTRGTFQSIADVDLSSAKTIGDIKSLVEAANLGVRVEINSSGTGLDVFNEIAGPALSIESVPARADTAGQLGIRSLSTDTLLADFNDGRGVRLVDGRINPLTGQADAAVNADISIRLGNGGSFEVDLRPQDVVSVQALIDRINAQAADAASAGRIPAGAVRAELGTSPNGLVLRDVLNLGPMTVTNLNNSAAAEDIGLLDGKFDAGSASFVAEDRSGVRVLNLFTNLMDLRDALRGDNSVGITLAGEQLERSNDRLATARATVGVYAERVNTAKSQLEDHQVLDEKMRSELQDVDFTAAAVRFSQLQSQLTAGLQTAARLQSRTLLDFLG